MGDLIHITDYPPRKPAPADTYCCDACDRIINWENDWPTQVGKLRFCTECYELCGVCDGCGDVRVLASENRDGDPSGLCFDCTNAPAKPKPAKPRLPILGQRYRVRWWVAGRIREETHNAWDPMLNLATRLGMSGSTVEFWLEQWHGAVVEQTKRLIVKWADKVQTRCPWED